MWIFGDRVDLRFLKTWMFSVSWTLVNVGGRTDSGSPKCSSDSDDLKNNLWCVQIYSVENWLLIAWKISKYPGVSQRLLVLLINS